MRCPILSELPPPPPGKRGWPWTQESPQVPDTMNDGAHWPKVSIVTPSYNQGQFIEETIRSVLLQSYPNLEYIIIDGGSTDGSVGIIRKYEPWLAYWVSEPDRGQSHAINKGFRLSQGDILAWLNSDDLLEPLAVYLAVAYLTAHPKVGMVYGDRIIADSDGNIVGHRYLPMFVSWQLRYCCGVNQEAAFWRQNLFFSAGELDESLNHCMDWDLWWRLTRLTTIRHLPAPMGRYRAHSTSKSFLTSSLNDQSEFVKRWQAEREAVPRRYMGRDTSRLERMILSRIRRALAYLERVSRYYARRQAYIRRLLNQIENGRGDVEIRR